MNRLKQAAAAIVAVMLTTLMPAKAVNADTIELGQLECYVDAGTGFIFGSTKDISCVFTPASGNGEPDNYFGVINKFGLDIGVTQASYISWLVIATSRIAYEPGFLQGDYAGASAEASFAIGLGANVLIGGSNKSFALQPLSVQAQTGFNIAAGIAEIELRSINQ